MTLNQDAMATIKMNNLTGVQTRDLNFINPDSPYTFRRYYRSGLRSHIFEVVRKTEVQIESEGILSDGIRLFPRAVPVKIFRIFRTRFRSIDDIFKEIDKYRTLLNVLGEEHIALSEEFLVDYRSGKERRTLLCGLQEYISGDILDPWRVAGPQSIEQMLATMTGSQSPPVKRALDQTASFLSRIRKMILDHGLIPDLAGVGNLILTPRGELRLVDINNIVPIAFSPEIPLDDKDYPSCDVSVQVLIMLEKKLLGNPADSGDPLFRHFLDRHRRRRVKTLEKRFYDRIN